MARQQIVSQDTGGIVRRGGIIARPTILSRREIVSTGTYGLSRKGKEVITPIRTLAPPDSVLVGIGEYVAKSEYDKLTNAEQAYLKKFGIDKFNKEQERVGEQSIRAYVQAEAFVERETRQQEKWYETHVVEVGADKEPVLKSLFDTLSPDQQRLLQEKGIAEYNRQAGEITSVVPDDLTPSEIFAYLKTVGTIPVEALFQSWDPKTKEITWKMPTRPIATIFSEMQVLGDIPKDATLTGYDRVTGEISYTLPTTTEDKGWFRNTVNYLKQALTVDESILTGQIFGINNPGLERAAAQVNKIFEVFAPQVETRLVDDPRGFFVETAKTVAAYMPFVWAVNWRGMSAESKIINGAIDAIIFVSLGLGAGLSKLKARPIVNAATNAGKAATKMKVSVRILAKTPIDDIAKYTRASSNAQKAIQASKVADNAFIVQLSKVGRITSRQLKIVEKASGVRGLRRAILDVSKAQSQLKAAWKPVTTLKLGGKKYIAQMAKVEAAQARLAKALATFDTKLQPRYKFTTSPEFKGFAMEWRKRILPTFEGGQPVVAPLGRGGKGVQLAVLEKVAPKVKLQTVFQMRLKPVYKKAVTAVRRVKPPLVKPGAKVATAAVAGAAIARKVGTKEALKQAATTIAKEAQRQATKISTRAVTRVKVETIVKEATRQAVDIMAIGKTAAQTRAMVALNIEAMIKALPLSETKTELQTETVVRTLTKTATALATKIITAFKTKPKGRIRLFIPSSDGTMRRMTYAELAGSVAWKQGFIYKLIYPPYGEGNILHSRKPFPGVKTLKGAGSAYKTIIKAGGKVPSSITRDMGIMDIEIKTPEKGKPTLMFRADIKQETRQGKRRVIPKRRPVKRRLQQVAAA